MTQPKDGEGAEALLGCPFCGNPEPEIRRNLIGDSYVICFTEEEGGTWCGATSSECGCETDAGAVQRWNRRAPPATPVRGGGGQGSSNASRAATRDHSLAATEAEPSAAEDALFAIRNQLGAAKASLQFNGRWINEAGYITDAALWIERSISAADEALAKPLPEAPR